MPENMNLGEIRKALKKNKFLAENSHGQETYNTDEEEWGSYDSHLMIGEKRSFKTSFNRVLPQEYHGLGLRKYIEKILSLKKEVGNSLYAVEFGGPGSKLFQGFTKGFFEKTVGVCLKDIRSEGQKEIDTSNHHSVVEGDIMDPLKEPSSQLLAQITTKLSAEKVDLIMSRMRGALIFIDKNLTIFDRILKNWYAMLNENGLMFVQFEVNPDTGREKNAEEELTENEIKIQEWAEILKKKIPAIDISIAGGLMRLHKGLHAPDRLP